MDIVSNSRVAGAIVDGLAAVFLTCAFARAADVAEEKAAMTEYVAVARPSILSSDAVLELYKLSGWKLLDVRRIWANENWPDGDPKTRHHAFTDLARFKGHWYCVFRVGEDHAVTGALGGLRVIRSTDGETWTSVFFYQPEEKSVDVRDSKLAVTQDGRLVLLAYESYRFEPAKTTFRDRWFREGEKTDGTIGRSMTWLTANGEEWQGPNLSDVTGNTWLWGCTWHRGAGYAVAHSGKHGRSGAIYRTSNGKDWELLAADIFPKDTQGKHQGNEASIFIDGDDSAWVYLRNAPRINRKMTNIGFARPPYREWDWSRQTSVNFGGPKMLRLADGRIVAAGRFSGRHGGGGYGDSVTALYELDVTAGVSHRIADLPSQGDNSYPGIVEKDGVLWISYYSCHEDPNPEKRRAHAQRSCIYLARVRIGGARYHYVDKYSLNPQPPDVEK